MDLFHFLCLHTGKRYTPARWAELVGIAIIDADGWRGFDFRDTCDLPTFIQRAKVCTIGPRREAEAPLSAERAGRAPTGLDEAAPG